MAVEEEIERTLRNAFVAYCEVENSEKKAGMLRTSEKELFKYSENVLVVQ
jgi:hypothetical protein